MNPRPTEGREQPPGWPLAAVFVAALALAYALRYALLPFAMVAALAFVCTPIVRLLHARLRLPRTVAVIVVYLVIVAATGLVCWYLVGNLGERAVRAAGDAPHLLAEEIRRLFGPDIHAFGQNISADDLAARIMQAAKNAVSNPKIALFGGALAVGAPATLVLMLVVLFYFLNSGGPLMNGVLRLAPPRYRGHLRDLGRRVEPMLRHYVRGVIVVTLYTGSVAYLVLGLWFHLPLAALVSIAVGVLEIVPVVGPAASMALIGVSAAIDGHGLWTFVGFMVFAVALRVSIDNVVGPLVLGRAVTIHPVVVIFAFLCGASLFGVLGVFVAVPVAAAVKIVLAVWYGDDAKEPA